MEHLLNLSSLRDTKNLKKIEAHHHFPCFECLDSEKRVTCLACEGRGYVQGSHPMVQFIEDFI